MHWKLRGRIAGTLLFAAMFVSANFPNAGSATAGDPAPRLQKANLQETDAASRRTVDRFLAISTGTDATPLQSASAKIELSDREGNTKSLWVSTLKKQGNLYTGRAAGSEKTTVTFHKHQIRDWSFVGRDGKIYGNYTTRSLLPSLQPQQATQIAIALSKTPTPVGW